MATSRTDNRRRSSGSSQRRKSSRSRNRRNEEERKPLQGRDTGYRVGSSHRQRTSRSINPRIIIAGIVGILVIIGIVFGVTSCVKGCSKTKKKEPEVEEVKVNPTDERVAYGVPADETTKIAEVLDQNEKFAKIAKNADKITDERIIDLAINEPEAIDFVLGYLKSDGSAQQFGGSATQGEYPKFFIYDERWGYVPYADGIVGITGSGPVALSMASMGLTGSTNYDPATIAQAVTTANLANGTTGMDDSFVTNHASEAGVTATSIEASSDGIYSYLAEGQPILIKLKADSGIGFSSAHWVLATQLNSDNSITVYDPTSADASSHPWSLGSVASKSDTAYTLTAATSYASTTDESQTADSYSEG